MPLSMYFTIAWFASLVAAQLGPIFGWEQAPLGDRLTSALRANASIGATWIWLTSSVWDCSSLSWVTASGP
jgi:hypothetical protein